MDRKQFKQRVAAQQLAEEQTNGYRCSGRLERETTPAGCRVGHHQSPVSIRPVLSKCTACEGLKLFKGLVVRSEALPLRQSAIPAFTSVLARFHGLAQPSPRCESLQLSSLKCPPYR